MNLIFVRLWQTNFGDDKSPFELLRFECHNLQRNCLIHTGNGTAQEMKEVAKALDRVPWLAHILSRYHVQPRF